MLERSAAQRRFDALRTIFERAASTAAGGRPPEPVVNIVVDQATFEAWLARMSADPDARSRDVESTRRCETTDGVQVAPADAVALALRGHVRRVVMDTAGVVIDLGRKVRLFTGSAREAAMLQGTRCLWPGCGRHRTHIDHTHDWQFDGPTDPANAGADVPPPRPPQEPRLHRLARRPRPLAHPPTRRHRDRRRLSM